MARPVWMVVRATVPFDGHQRDELGTIDATDPYWQGKLRGGRVIPLPACDQPVFDTGPDGQPALAKDLGLGLGGLAPAPEKPDKAKS